MIITKTTPREIVRNYKAVFALVRETKQPAVVITQKNNPKWQLSAWKICENWSRPSIGSPLKPFSIWQVLFPRGVDCLSIYPKSMTNTPGTKPDFIVIGDSDGLIALLHEEDLHFAVAQATVKYLLDHEASVLFPITSIVETVTTFQRKLSEPRLAAKVIERITRGGLAIEPVDANLLEGALRLFNPHASKQHTLFDAIVAATAKKREAQVIFSFDRWYKKLGLTLACDMVTESA